MKSRANADEGQAWEDSPEFEEEFGDPVEEARVEHEAQLAHDRARRSSSAFTGSSEPVRIKVVKHHWGLVIGPFEDRYEIATKCTRATAVDCISAAMFMLGCKVSGCAYDGAMIFYFSPRPPHEVSFYGHEVWCYVQEGSVVLKDAFSGWRLSLRLWPSLLRRRLPAIARELQ